MRLFAGGVGANLLKISVQKHHQGLFRMKSTSTLDLYRSLVVKERDRKAAIIDHKGKTTYNQLKVKSDAISRALKRELPADKEGHQHVSLLCGNNTTYVQALLAIWKSGKVAIPLCQSHPAATLDYYITGTVCYTQSHPLSYTT